MSPLRPTLLCAAGIMAGFAAGWFLKPAPVLESAGQARNGASRRIAPPGPLAGRPVGTAGETWLDAAASADAAAVRGAARPGGVNPVLLEKLESVLAMPDPMERQARWSALLLLMRLEDAGAVRALLQKNRAFTEEATVFWQQCGRMDSIAALNWAAEEGGWAIPDVLGGWASMDSSAALKWLKDNSERVEPIRAVAGLVRGLAARSPEAAARFLQANAEDRLFWRSLDMATDLIIRSRGIAAAHQWFRDLAESDASDTFKSANLERLLFYGQTAVGGTGAALNMELVHTAAKYALEPWFSRYAAGRLVMYIEELDPAAGAAVMERLENTRVREHFMESFLSLWPVKDAALRSAWLENNRASPFFDTMTSRLARHLSEKDPEAARKWAAQISDSVRREQLEKELSLSPIK